jgi:fused signal recognition particle receptor
MFGFLKDKLKGALKKFSKDVEEQSETVVEEVVVEKKVEKPKKEKVPVAPKKEKPKKEEKKVVVKKEKKEKVKEEKKPEVKKESKKEVPKKEKVEEPVPEEAPKKKGFFSRLFTKKDEEPVAIEEKPEEKKQKKVEEVKKPEVKKEKKSPKKKVVEKAVEEIKEDVREELEKEIEGEKEEPVEEEPEKEIEAPKEIIEEEKEEVIIEKDIPEVIEEEIEEEIIPEPEEEQPVPEEEVIEEDPEEKKGFFKRFTEKITKTVLKEDKFNDLFFEIEIALLENNVSVEVIEKIKEDLKKEVVGKGVKRGALEETILKTLKTSLTGLFDVEQIDILKATKQKTPYVMMFVGVNGSGKTTTLAKVVKYYQDNNKTCVIAACDTFRAAAIQQLEEHADNLKVKMIKHDYGADPAAVAYDAIEHAKAKGLDVVLIDTAGRLHSNTNLMDELAKVERVAKPDITIFVGESITGNDCVEQATKFSDAVDIDAIILTKMDVDEKGGAAISISYVTGKPILFWCNGQTYEDLQKFDKKVILDNIGL